MREETKTVVGSLHCGRNLQVLSTIVQSFLPFKSAQLLFKQMFFLPKYYFFDNYLKQITYFYWWIIFLCLGNMKKRLYHFWSKIWNSGHSDTWGFFRGFAKIIVKKWLWVLKSREFTALFSRCFSCRRKWSWYSRSIS